MLFKFFYRLGDKLEDKVRGKLSHWPIIYAFIGGAGVIIFWRGVWHSMDYLMGYFMAVNTASSMALSESVWWDGPLSIVVGMFLLLITGLFVTSFIGNEIIISGLKGEKRVAEKTEQEIKESVSVDIRTERELKNISERLEAIEKKIK